jgi:DNA-sulfur modification-associated
LSSATISLTGQTLADVVDFPGSNRFIYVNTKRAINLGAFTMMTSLDIGTFLHQSMIGNDPLKGPITQRKLDMGHAQKMAGFIFKGLLHYTMDRYGLQDKPVPEEVKTIAHYLGTQPYYAWAPIVGSIRNDFKDIALENSDPDKGEYVLKLRTNQMIWVVDGQHRRVAWALVRDYLNQLVRDRKYSKSGGLVPSELKQVSDDALTFWHEALTYYTERFSITIDLHFGLTIEQEKQLFHDLNNLQKTVATSQAQAFDQSNPINIFTHRLIDGELFGDAKITYDGRLDWEDEAWMKLDALNSINARLFLNQTSISGAKQPDINDKEERAWAFWETITKIPGVFGRNDSVAAQPALLKAIARVYFDILWSRKLEGQDVADQFLQKIPEIDFSHENPLWDIEHLSDEDIAKYPRLPTYLPENWREKSIGSRIDGKIRFGSRHNESILVLPGLIRYLAGLNPKVESAPKRKAAADE